MPPLERLLVLLHGVSPALRAHKEVLYFASPFFEAALSGDWMETARRQSISSVITISRLPSVPEGQSLGEATTEMAFTPIDQDQDPDELDIDDVDPPKSDGGNGGEQVKAKAIAASLGKLEGSSASGSSDTHQSSDSASAAGSPIPDNGNLPPRSFLKASKPSPEKVIRRIRNNSPDAVIVLKEERVCSAVILVSSFLLLIGHMIGPYLSRLSKICVPSVRSFYVPTHSHE